MEGWQVPLLLVQLLENPTLLPPKEKAEQDRETKEKAGLYPVKSTQEIREQPLQRGDKQATVGKTGSLPTSTQPLHSTPPAPPPNPPPPPPVEPQRKRQSKGEPSGKVVVVGAAAAAEDANKLQATNSRQKQDQLPAQPRTPKRKHSEEKRHNPRPLRQTRADWRKVWTREWKRGVGGRQLQCGQPMLRETTI